MKTYVSLDRFFKQISPLPEGLSKHRTSAVIEMSDDSTSCCFFDETCSVDCRESLAVVTIGGCDSRLNLNLALGSLFFCWSFNFVRSFDSNWSARKAPHTYNGCCHSFAPTRSNHWWLIHTRWPRCKRAKFGLKSSLHSAYFHSAFDSPLRRVILLQQSLLQAVDVLTWNGNWLSAFGLQSLVVFVVLWRETPRRSVTWSIWTPQTPTPYLRFFPFHRLTCSQSRNQVLQRAFWSMPFLSHWVVVAHICVLFYSTNISKILSRPWHGHTLWSCCRSGCITRWRCVVCV